MGNCISNKQKEQKDQKMQTMVEVEEKKEEIEEIKEEETCVSVINDIIKKELDTINKMSMQNIKNIHIEKKTGINVLYIEDNQIYFFLIKQILKKHYKNDVNIIWKTCLKDGYQYIKDNEIDLILLDRTLDDGLGDDLIYKLEKEEYNIKKIILISVIDDLRDVEKFNKMGLNYYIKPLKVQEFVKTMDIIFNRI